MCSNWSTPARDCGDWEGVTWGASWATWTDPDHDHGDQPSPPDSGGCIQSDIFSDLGSADAAVTGMGKACTDGNPVDVFTGRDIDVSFDMGYPAPSSVRILRSYKSDNLKIGAFGKGTTLQYDQYLTYYSSDDLMEYVTPDGAMYILTNATDGSYTSDGIRFLEHTRAYPEDGGEPRRIEFTGGLTYIFNSTSGLLEKEVDVHGNWMQISRDQTSGFINGVSDSFGRSLSFVTNTVTVDSVSYDVIESITDVMDNQVSYVYNSTNGTLMSVTHVDGSTISYGYDSNGIMNSVTNADNVTQLINIYNATTSRVESQELANQGTFGFSYVTDGTSSIMKETTVTDPGSNTRTYKFNSIGYITETVDGDGNSTLYGREAFTNALINTTDPLGRRTDITYDTNGFINSVTDPAGNTTTFVYNATFGKPEQITSALGNTTTLEYDSKGNLTEIWLPESTNAFMTVTNTPSGLANTVSNALGETITYEYYSTGQIANVVDPLSNTIAHYEYNAIGRLVNATSPYPGSNTTSYIYNSTTTRLDEIKDALGNSTRFTYNTLGKVTTVTDAKAEAGVITYNFNNRGLVNSVTDQLDNSESYTYDLDDNLTSYTDREGQTFTYEYDSLDRIVNAVAPAETGIANRIEFTYDAASRITNVAGYEGASLTNSIGYTYTSGSGDKHEDRVKEVTTNYGGLTNSITYSYDEMGRRTSMQVEDLPQVDYSYSENGWLTEISTLVNGTAMTFSIDYDEAGRRSSLTYQYGVTNAVTATYGYTAAGMVNSIAFTNSTSGALETLSYTYDTIYNRTSMTRDGVDVKVPTAFSNAPAYNAANRLTSFNGATILHDDNGNMTSWGSTTYTWNASNQLMAINGTSLDASFTYDIMGRRIAKTINGVTTKYLYDGADIVMEMNENDVATAYYIHGPGVDEPLARIELDSGGNVTSIRFYLADALGSAIALTDENGTVKTQYNYTPFGAVEITGESSDNPFLFTGREWDGDTGLYFYRARYYSPELGRFITEDPIGLAGGINMYAYVGNNPLNFVDPLGLSATMAVGGLLLEGAKDVAIVSGLAVGGLVVGGAIGIVLLTPSEAECPELDDPPSDKPDYGCELLYQNDLNICRSLKNPGARSRCYASAMERKNACDLKKPLPPLITW